MIGGNCQRLVSQKGFIRGKVECGPRGDCTISDIQFGVGIRGNAIEDKPDRFACGNLKFIECRRSTGQIVLIGNAEDEYFGIHVNSVQRRLEVVGITQLWQGIQNVTAHDDVIQTWIHTWSGSGQRAAVAGTAWYVSLHIHAAN